GLNAANTTSIPQCMRKALKLFRSKRFCGAAQSFSGFIAQLHAGFDQIVGHAFEAEQSFVAQIDTLAQDASDEGGAFVEAHLEQQVCANTPHESHEVIPQLQPASEQLLEHMDDFIQVVADDAADVIPDDLQQVDDDVKGLLQLQRIQDHPKRVV